MAQTSDGREMPKLSKEEAQLIGNSVLHDLKVRGLRHKTARSYHGRTCFKRAAKVARDNLSVWLRDGQIPKHSARFLLNNDQTGHILEKFGIQRIAEVSAVSAENTSEDGAGSSSMHPPAAYIAGINFDVDSSNFEDFANQQEGTAEDPEPMDYTGQEEAEDEEEAEAQYAEGCCAVDGDGGEHCISVDDECSDPVESEGLTSITPPPVFNVRYLPTDDELRVFEEQLLQVEDEDLSCDGQESTLFGENGALISSVQSFLTKMKRGCIERQTLMEILRGWAVKYHSSDASITELLLLLKLLRPDPEYEKLPWSARQLFKVL